MDSFHGITDNFSLSTLITLTFPRPSTVQIPILFKNSDQFLRLQMNTTSLIHQQILCINNSVPNTKEWVRNLYLDLLGGF